MSSSYVNYCSASTLSKIENFHAVESGVYNSPLCLIVRTLYPEIQTKRFLIIVHLLCHCLGPKSEGKP